MKMYERRPTELVNPFDTSTMLLHFASLLQVFYSLLTCPVPTCDKDGRLVDILVEDILGPKGDDGVLKPPCFSLLHYSVNLNPSLRQQIGARYVRR